MAYRSLKRRVEQLKARLDTSYPAFSPGNFTEEDLDAIGEILVATFDRELDYLARGETGHLGPEWWAKVFASPDLLRAVEAELEWRRSEPKPAEEKKERACDLLLKIVRSWDGEGGGR